MMGFIEGEDGRKALRQTADQRRQGTIASFVRYYGEAARNPLEYIEQSWAAEEWTRGCYAGYFPPGVWLDYGEALRAPIGRMHWAGTETAEIWNGYLDRKSVGEGKGVSVRVDIGGRRILKTTKQKKS